MTSTITLVDATGCETTRANVTAKQNAAVTTKAGHRVPDTSEPTTQATAPPSSTVSIVIRRLR
jgi:hypothetical protein